MDASGTESLGHELRAEEFSHLMGPPDWEWGLEHVPKGVLCGEGFVGASEKRLEVQILPQVGPQAPNESVRQGPDSETVQPQLDHPVVRGLDGVGRLEDEERVAVTRP